MVAILIPIVFFLATAAVLIALITTRHRERMTMVEKGLTGDEIKAMYTKTGERDPLTSLKWGILFVFGGLAVLLGNLLHDYYHVEKGGTIIGMVGVFVGAGLLLFYGIATKKKKTQ